MGRNPKGDAGKAGARPAVRAFVDTNVLIRHLTGDPPQLAKRCTRFIANATGLFLADLILAEVVYVLESVYATPRAQIAEAARTIISFDAITVGDQRVLTRTIEVYENDRLDFAEAYLVAVAEADGIDEIVSFDQSIDRVESVRRVVPQ